MHTQQYTTTPTHNFLVSVSYHNVYKINGTSGPGTKTVKNYANGVWHVKGLSNENVYIYAAIQREWIKHLRVYILRSPSSHDGTQYGNLMIIVN